MTEFREKIQTALDECRMLILGGQVLISFAAEGVLEPGFVELSAVGRACCMAGMACLVLAVGLFMAPAAYHQIACRGEDRPELQRLTCRIAAVGLIPFAAGLVCAVYVVGERAVSARGGVIVAVGVAALAASMWYGMPLGRRNKYAEAAMSEQDVSTPLSDRIHKVLTEARMVLPGAQALLGFGSVSVLMDRFKALPESLRAVHLGGLSAIAVAVVLLMTPPAFHRIAESGEHTERLYRVASAFLLLGMAFLALGMAAAMWLVMEVGSGSRLVGEAGAAIVLAVFVTMWFVWPVAKRRRWLR